ncbi:radical SAM/SPASM domain-containing protein [Finegoldia magna]|uniref:radical SAM/SPASM domain-containing protein n=1 Tax=Finegoldia magna TaxID=1260 RepID=UPI000B9188B7|nr:radical SAM protein [Finegoldia magna]OXZ38067.1 hypothetical protein B9N50_07890 [Finegoldia magna]
MDYTIYLTTDCNFKCKYCYENYRDSFKLNKITADKIIKFIENNFSSDTITISFMGGEPLLNKELIYYFIENLEKKIDYRKIKYSITTNCSLISDDVVNLFKIKKFEVKCSIDGNKYTHNKNRISKNNYDCYDFIIKHIKSMLLEGIDISIRMTVTNNTIEDLSKNIEYFYNLGVRKISIIFDVFMKINSFEKKLIKNELNKIKKFYLKKIMDRDKLNIAQIDGKFINLLSDFGKHFTMCDAGVTNLKIMPDGNIYPCGFVTDMPYCKLGNIDNNKYKYEKNLGKSLAYNLYDNNQKKCNDCEYINFCLGMKCGYMNYIVTGSINVPSDTTCIIEKLFYEIVKEILHDLAKDDNLIHEYIYPYILFIKESNLKLSRLGENLLYE